MKVNILAIGDIVGRPGREILKTQLPEIISANKIDFCVANAENAAGGSGITPPIADELLSYGINILTSGDHIYKQKEIVPYLRSRSGVPTEASGKDKTTLLRPANYSPEAAGPGHTIFTTANNIKIGVINLQGRVFMPPTECPFHTVDKIIAQLRGQSDIIIVDMHAEATSEKVALGWHLDGRVGLVFGTHTHIQTADECILPNGTGYITDVGMTGPYDSVIGRRKDRILSAFITQMPIAFDVAKDDVRICGVIVTIDAKTGKALKIKRIIHKQEL